MEAKYKKDGTILVGNEKKSFRQLVELFNRCTRRNDSLIIEVAKKEAVISFLESKVSVVTNDIENWPSWKEDYKLTENS